MIDFAYLLQQHRSVQTLARQGNLEAARRMQVELIDHMHSLGTGLSLPEHTCSGADSGRDICIRNARILRCILGMARQGASVYANSMNKVFLLLFGTAFLLVLIGLIPYKIIQNDKTEAARERLDRIAEIVHAAKSKTGKSLREITGMECISCECARGVNIQGAAYDGKCFRNWVKALSSLLLAASDEPFEVEDPVGRLLLPPDLLRDPWGAPFLLETDEGARSGSCSEESVVSVGHSGVVGSHTTLRKNISAPCQP